VPAPEQKLWRQTPTYGQNPRGSFPKSILTVLQSPLLLALHPVQRTEAHTPIVPDVVHVQTNGDAHSWSPIVSALQGPPSPDLGMHFFVDWLHQAVVMQSPSPLHIVLHVEPLAQVA
jgi:hypothetical protein